MRAFFARAFLKKKKTTMGIFHRYKQAFNDPNVYPFVLRRRVFLLPGRRLLVPANDGADSEGGQRNNREHLPRVPARLHERAL